MKFVDLNFKVLVKVDLKETLTYEYWPWQWIDLVSTSITFFMVSESSYYQELVKPLPPIITYRLGCYFLLLDKINYNIIGLSPPSRIRRYTIMLRSLSWTNNEIDYTTVHSPIQNFILFFKKKGIIGILFLRMPRSATGGRYEEQVSMLHIKPEKGIWN